MRHIRIKQWDGGKGYIYRDAIYNTQSDVPPIFQCHTESFMRRHTTNLDITLKDGTEFTKIEFHC